MSTTEEGLDPALEMWGPHVADDPHATYRQLLSACPVAHSNMLGTETVYVFDYEDIAWAMRHPEIFSSTQNVEIGQEQPLIPLQVDPPLHTSYRRLLNPKFTPKRIAEMEPEVRALVNQLIDGFCDKGSCEFNDEFATPLPSTIFLRLMGLPLGDLPTFLEWRDNIIRPDVEFGDLDGAAAIRAETGKATNAYFVDAIAKARREPNEGLLGELVDAEFEGRKLTEAELLGICQLMLLGGLDTVTATLDCMITYLARHPEHRQELVDDPSLIPAAIEELLRHQTPVMVIPRAIACPATLQGVDLKEGDAAVLVLGAGNIDTAEFAHPEDVDFHRGTNRHLAFGGGHHLCLGAHLARLELRVALEELHRRIPHYRLAEGADPHFSPGIRQADHLPLVWD